MSNEKQNITIEIEGRRYPLSIVRSREEIYRRAEVGIRKKIEEYKRIFKLDPTGRAFDLQDFLAMTALYFAVHDERETDDKQQLIQVIEELENELELFLD